MIKSYIKTVGLAVLLLLTSSQAIFEKNIGINDWHLEHLGELHDVKFVEKQQEQDVPS